MPTIKLKKATADYIAEKEREKEREKEKNEGTPKKDKSQSKDKSEGMLKGLDGEVLFDKRKRSTPPSEQAAIDWINEHLVSKAGVHIYVPRLYEHYADACQTTSLSSSVVELNHFHTILTNLVGKEFSFKSTSPLQHVLSEKSIQTVKKKPKGEKNELKLKLKDVLAGVLKDMGNSRKGLRFAKLKQAVSIKYPALRVKNGFLRNALEKAVFAEEITLVKGVGFAGSYRCTGEPSESEVEEEEKEDKIKSEKKKENGVTDDDNKGKNKKKKKRDGATENEDDKDSLKTENGKEEADSTEATKKKMKKKTTKKVYKPVSQQSINHSDPQRIEDIFPLAITYSCEPKECSMLRMKNYIERHYPKVDVEKKLKPALEKGVDLGMWEKSHGTTYRLNIGEFDATLKDSIDDSICAAIIASTEPKIASCFNIRKYIQEFHPDFNIDSKPWLLSHGLDRACKKQILQQLSGIGATGSFLISFPFTPSPGILAGDERQEEAERLCTDIDAYKAKPSKSRSVPISGSATSPIPTYRAPPKDRTQVSKAAKPKRSTTDSNKTKRSKSVKTVKTVGKTKKKGRKEKKRRSNKAVEAEEEDVEEEDEVEEEAEAEEKEEEEEITKPEPKKLKSTPRTSKSSKSKAEVNVTSEESETTPASSSRRKRSTPSLKDRDRSGSRSSRGKSLTSYREDSDPDMSDREEGEPAVKKSRGRK